MATRKKPPAAPKKPTPRKDFGAPIDAYFAKFDGEQRKILDTLKALITAAVPKAEAAIKWGMPMWTLNGTKMICALRATKSHVGLLVSGPPELFDDPDQLLEGSAQNMRQLKVTASGEIPKKLVTAWVKAAAAK
ncbi:MAG: DUF1801 domain-containing protein [Archangium sp.]